MLFLVHYSVRSGGPWTPRSRFPPPPGDAPAVGAYGSTFLGMIFSTKTLRKIHGLDVLIALSALHGHEASMSDRLCFALGARLTVHFLKSGTGAKLPKEYQGPSMSDDITILQGPSSSCMMRSNGRVASPAEMLCQRRTVSGRQSCSGYHEIGLFRAP